MKNYRVKHTMVGPFPEGRVVSHREMMIAGADLDHLKKADAIEEVTDPVSTDPIPPTIQGQRHVEKMRLASSNDDLTGMSDRKLRAELKSLEGDPKGKSREDLIAAITEARAAAGAPATGSSVVEVKGNADEDKGDSDDDADEDEEDDTDTK